MYPEALTYLRCSCDQSTPLALEPGASRAADGELVGGMLRCPACGARYPISAGVLDMLGPLALPDSPAQLTNALPPTAWAYERTWRPRALTLLSGEPFGYERELPLMRSLAAPERGGLIIDVACSNGLYARALERGRGDATGHVIGIDHAMPMLRQARSFARSEGLRISYVRAKAQQLPFGTGTATTLAMGGSLNEIGDVDAALRELRRVLATQGRLVQMCLVRSEALPGRVVQSALALGGITFPPLHALNLSFAAAGLALRAQWRYGVVVFSLLQA